MRVVSTDEVRDDVLDGTVNIVLGRITLPRNLERVIAAGDHVELGALETPHDGSELVLRAEGVAGSLRSHFSRGQFTEGLKRALREIGEEFKRHCASANA